jgi:hypothetical protein
VQGGQYSYNNPLVSGFARRLISLSVSNLQYSVSHVVKSLTLNFMLILTTLYTVSQQPTAQLGGWMGLFHHGRIQIDWRDNVAVAGDVGTRMWASFSLVIFKMCIASFGIQATGGLNRDR